MRCGCFYPYPAPAPKPNPNPNPNSNPDPNPNPNPNSPGGLRLPRAPTPGQRDGNGLCPGLAVLRHFGDPKMQGPWLAAGGSLLWDPSKEERQVASLRVGAIAQPAPGQQLTVGFDEKVSPNPNHPPSPFTFTLTLAPTLTSTPPLTLTPTPTRASSAAASRR